MAAIVDQVKDESRRKELRSHDEKEDYLDEGFLRLFLVCLSPLPPISLFCTSQRFLHCLALLTNNEFEEEMAHNFFVIFITFDCTLKLSCAVSWLICYAVYGHAFVSATVNYTGSDCPYSLKMIACHLLLEITSFLRETYQHMPRSRTSRQSGVGLEAATSWADKQTGDCVASTSAKLPVNAFSLLYCMMRH